MALALFDRVQETTTTTGTGSITLGGAVPGFQSFAVVGNGNTCYYTIVDVSAWEVGIGTYSTSGPTLARTTILSNSNGNTTAITLSAGTKSVFLTYPTSKSVNLNESGNVSALGTVSSGVWQGTTVGVAYGGTGVTASSGANSVVLRDADQNIAINRLNQGLLTTTASGGTTVLTVASAFNQALVGTGGHTYRLPDATTLSNTTAFQFNNNATGTLTIQNNAGTQVGTIAPGGAAGIALLSNATTGGTWDVHAYIPENVTWGTNALALGSTVISGGTWNGGVIATNYGGTGLTSYTSGGAVYANSTTTLTSGTLPTSAGGTGNTTGNSATTSQTNFSNLTIGGSQVLYAGNYNSYAPTLTGGGASGTWAINVTGNAATATTATTATNQSGGTVSATTGAFSGAVSMTANAQGYASPTLYVRGDIRAQRDTGNTGVIYFGNSSGTYLYYDGSNYAMPNGQLDVNGSRVLNAGNYNSYAPTLTGGGATGTWNINISGNAATATLATTATTALITQNTFASGTGGNLLYATVGSDDFVRIRAGSDSYNTGWLEIATADDGNEPIYVRQYTGVFATVTRTLTLLDGSGNTSLPGTISASSFAGSIATGSGASGTWNISITGSAGSAGSVDYNALTNKGGGTGSYITSGDYRAPIFYDSNDTGYYVDPNSNSKLYYLQILGSTGFDGLTSLNVTNNAYIYGRAQIIITGRLDSGNDGWALNGRNAVLFNINSGGAQGATGTTNFALQYNMYTGQLGVMSSASAGTPAIYWSTGDLHTRLNGNIYAPIFYDSNNTNYYVDPASGSNLYNATLRGSNFSMYTGAYGMQMYSTLDGAGNPGGWARSLNFANGTASVNLASFGALGSGDSIDYAYLALGTDPTNYASGVYLRLYSNYTQASGSMRAPIFYDSDNTAYYVDPASVSNLNAAVFNGQTVWNGQLYISGTNFNTLNSGYANAADGSDIWLNYRGYNDGFSYFRNFNVGNGKGTAYIWGDGVNGYVGIGTGQSANARLHVRQSTPTSVGALPGGVTMISDSSTNNYLLFRNTADNGTYGGIAFQDNNVGGYVVFGNAGGGGDLLYVAGYGGGQLQYGYTDSINPGARTTIASWNPTGLQVNSGDFRAPIWYDSNDTAYYIDPNGYSRTFFNSIYVGNEAPNTGANSSSDGLVLRGNYNSNSWAHKFHKYDNGSGVALYLSQTAGASAWGVLQGWGSGIGYTSVIYGTLSTDAEYSPIYYDRDNTAFYLNPNGTSVLNVLDGPALSDSKLYLRTRGDDNHYLWNDGSDYEELVMYRGTGFKVSNSSGLGTVLLVYGYDTGNYVYSPTSFRAPIFYDSENTGYYCNPNGTSNFLGLTVGSEISGSVNGFARYLPTAYAGGVQSNPQVYFSYDIGLKAAMTGVPFAWCDTLWINGYAGADVPNMVAIHTARDGTPRMWISTQSNRATSYGTTYQVPTYDTNYNNGGLYAGIYYDSQDTARYFNGNGGINFITGSGNRVTVYSDDSGLHVANAEGSGVDVRLGAAYNLPGIYVNPNLYLQSESTIVFRIANAERGYFDTGSNLFANGSMRSPIFYDQNNTAYYVDPASTSRLNETLTNVVSLPQNPVGSTYGTGAGIPPYSFYQVCGDNDGMRIYSEAPSSNNVRMVFQLEDDNETAYSDQWVFRNKLTYGALTATSPFAIGGSGNVTAAGNVTAYSDERLKTNWRDMPDNFVARLANVKVGIYDRTDTKNMTQVGVSAQSLQEVLPQAVNTADNEMKTLSVSYGNAALASAVELAKYVTALEQRISQLEARL